jgi:hypothetical protein
MFRRFRKMNFKRQHYTAKEIYDDLRKYHGEHIAIIKIIPPGDLYIESFYGDEEILKQILSGYDGELVETSIKGNFYLYL